MICTYKEKLNEVQKTPSRIQSNPSVNISMEKYSSTVKYLSGKPSLRPNGVVVVELLEIAMINVVHYTRNSAMLEWHFFFSNTYNLTLVLEEIFVAVGERSR